MRKYPICITAEGLSAVGSPVGLEAAWRLGNPPSRSRGRRTSLWWLLAVVLVVGATTMAAASAAAAPAAAAPAATAPSCVKYDDVGGNGVWPYNFRAIDNILYAGGSLSAPKAPKNPPAKVRAYLEALRSLGVTTVICLNIPRDDSEIRVIEQLAPGLNLQVRRFAMHAEKVPTAAEWAEMLQLIAGKAYVHCQWGADRTGAIIARYLRDRHGYSGRAAWEAVIKGGSHAGKCGGLKVDPKYANLVRFIWPEVDREDAEVCAKYQIRWRGPRLPVATPHAPVHR